MVGISLEKTNLHDSYLMNLSACLPGPDHLSSLIGEVPATVLEIGCKDILRILKDMSEILSWHRPLSSSVSEAAQNYF